MLLSKLRREFPEAMGPKASIDSQCERKIVSAGRGGLKREFRFHARLMENDLTNETDEKLSLLPLSPHKALQLSSPSRLTLPQNPYSNNPSEVSPTNPSTPAHALSLFPRRHCSKTSDSQSLHGTKPRNFAAADWNCSAPFVYTLRFDFFRRCRCRAIRLQ